MSAITTQIDVAAGDRLSFDYAFALDDDEGNPVVDGDRAFFTVDGRTFKIGTTLITFPNDPAAPTVDNLRPGDFFEFEYRFEKAGTFQIGLASLENLDEPGAEPGPFSGDGDAFASSLLVDNVRLTPIPSPSAAAAGGVMMLVLGMRRRRHAG